MPERQGRGLEAGGPERTPTLNLKVTFADGNHLNTRFNGTMDEAKAYYVGQSFNFGDTEAHPTDRMVNGVKVEEYLPDGSLAGEPELGASAATGTGAPKAAQSPSENLLAAFGNPRPVEWKACSKEMPLVGVKVRVMNVENGTQDTGEWCEYHHPDASIPGEWNLDLGIGDVTHWAPLDAEVPSPEVQAVLDQHKVAFDKIDFQPLAQALVNYADAVAAPFLAKPVVPKPVKEFEFGVSVFYDKNHTMHSATLDLSEWAGTVTRGTAGDFIQAWRMGRPLDMVAACEPLADHAAKALGDHWCLDLGKLQIPSSGGADELERWLLKTRPDFKDFWQMGNRDVLIKSLTDKALEGSYRTINLKTAEALAYEAIEDYEFPEVSSGLDPVLEHDKVTARIPEWFGKTYDELVSALTQAIYDEADARAEAERDPDARRDAAEMASERVFDQATLDGPDRPEWRE
jgi:hypothetical protein